MTFAVLAAYLATILMTLYKVLFHHIQAGLRQQMQDKAKAGELRVVNGAEAQKPAKRRRWDVAGGAEEGAAPAPKKKSSWDAAEAATPSNSRWDETPGRPKGKSHIKIQAAISLKKRSISLLILLGVPS